MINPNDIGLIIFDMDGTIAESLEPVYESVKRAFARLGWPLTFSQEDIMPYFGLAAPASGGGLYEFIRPKDSPLTWSELRAKIMDEYPDAFRERMKAYPGVKETLQTLRRRGYKLAQYSNGSAQYLNTVIDTLGIRDCYDHIECVQETGITKAGLIQKIRDLFDRVNAAIVGDRVHDIEAARDTGSLSIGALYGYGGKEPEQADLNIKKFEELLDILPPKMPTW